MIKTSQRSKLALGILAAAMAIPAVSQAALVEDSKASLELRNMYLNRDYRNDSGSTRPSYGEYWGQGFIAKFESGFTEGPVGFGVDAIGLLGVKLDSGKGRVNGAANGGGIGMSPLESDGSPVDDYSELGLTAKARLSKSVLQIGTLMPALPVVAVNNTRLLPGTYTGGMLTSQEIAGLTVHAGRLTQYNLRDQSHDADFDDSTSRSDDEIDNFDFAGASYAFTPQLTASYYYGDYDNAYKQHFAGLVHTLPLGEGLSLRSDLRYFNSKETGDNFLRPSATATTGIIDNDMYQGMFTLAAGAHKFGVGYQELNGDGAFPTIAGSDPFSINLVTFNTFTQAETDAWQVRYDYDFASMGVPGLAFMTRYVSASDTQTATDSNAKQWERDTDVVYTLQSGALKGLRFHVRNVTYRSEAVLPDVNENRLIVSYTLPLL